MATPTVFSVGPLPGGASYTVPDGFMLVGTFCSSLGQGAAFNVNIGTISYGSPGPGTPLNPVVAPPLSVITTNANEKISFTGFLFPYSA